jgi:16S rRNA (adenine1518-N6/adenine1519-N6)-dimethyltransferase
MPKLDKSLGQHHLTSGAICSPLVRWLEPEGRLVVEIGPGGGVLTERLIAAGAHVVGVEIDLHWAFVASSACPSSQIAACDALQIAWQRLPAGAAVAGNLPYNVSTAIIELLLDRVPASTRFGFLVQLEVAERLCAAPRSSAYGSFSVLAQTSVPWRVLARVKPGSFHPPPKVQSAFVGGMLAPREMPLAEWLLYKTFVRACFARRRKTLANSLRGVPVDRFERPPVVLDRAAVEGLLARLQRPPLSRAEELDVAEYLQLWQQVAQI